MGSPVASASGPQSSSSPCSAAADRNGVTGMVSVMVRSGPLGGGSAIYGMDSVSVALLGERQRDRVGGQLAAALLVKPVQAKPGRVHYVGEAGQHQVGHGPGHAGAAHHAVPRGG